MVTLEASTMIVPSTRRWLITVPSWRIVIEPEGFR
jgi:hypothetical protein